MVARRSLPRPLKRAPATRHPRRPPRRSAPATSPRRGAPATHPRRSEPKCVNGPAITCPNAYLGTPSNEPKCVNGLTRIARRRVAAGADSGDLPGMRLDGCQSGPEREGILGRDAAMAGGGPVIGGGAGPAAGPVAGAASTGGAGPAGGYIFRASGWLVIGAARRGSAAGTAGSSGNGNQQAQPRITRRVQVSAPRHDIRFAGAAPARCRPWLVQVSLLAPLHRGGCVLVMVSSTSSRDFVGNGVIYRFCDRSLRSVAIRSAIVNSLNVINCGVANVPGPGTVVHLPGPGTDGRRG